MSDFDDEDFLSEQPKEVTEIEGLLDQEVMEEVLKLINLDIDIATQESKLSAIKAERLRIGSTVIPEMFQKKKWSMMKMKNGMKIEITEDISVSVPAKDLEKRKLALDWLKANEGASLIAKEVALGEWSEEKVSKLQVLGLTYLVQESVNTNSLRSWIKGKLGMKKNSIPTLALSEIPPFLSPFLIKDTKISK